MMILVIETYQQKVEADPTAPLGTRVLPEYEMTNRTTYPNGGGHKNQRAFRKHITAMEPRAKFDDQGRATVSLGREWGIHSYQLIWLEAES